MAKQAHLQAILSAVDKISPVLRNVTGAALTTRMGLGALNTVSFAATSRKLAMLGKTFRDVGTASRGVLGGLGLPATVGMGAIAAGFVAAARGALEYAGALQDASDNTGIAVEPLQQLQGVFAQAGVSGEDFTAAMIKLNKGMAEAAAGKDKGFAALMTKLRIPLRNAKGEIRGVEEVMGELSDAFEKNTNPAVRTRIAMELFGKAGGKFIGVLAQGGKSLRDARKEMEQLGVVMSGGAVKRLDDLGDTFGLMGQQIKTQFGEAFAVAAPAIQKATRGLMDWIASNKEMLQLKVGAFIENMATAFGTWVESGGIERLTKGIGDVTDGIGEFIDKVGGVQNVLIGIGALILAGPVASLVSLAAALGRVALLFAGPLLSGFMALWRTLAVGQIVLAGMSVSFGALALAALPFIAIAVGIGAVAWAIYDNWSGIASFFGGIWKSISATAADLWPKLKDVFISGLSLLGGVLMAWTPLGLIVKAWAPVLSFLGDMWTKVGNIVAKITGAGSTISAAESAGAGFDAMGNATGAPMLSGPTPLARAGALQQPTARVQGDMKVSFVNAPAGMRVEESGTNAPGFGMQSRVDYGVRGGGIG